MAIKFGAHHKKEKTLLLIGIIAFAIGGVIVSFLIGQQNFAPLVLKPVKPLEPKMNWDILSDTRLEKLQPLQEIPVLKGEPGRDNPFLSIEAGETEEESGEESE